MERTMSHTYGRHRETDFQKCRRLLKRALVRFIRKHIAKLIFIGLPLLGMIAGIFIGVKVSDYAHARKLNDYGRKIAYVNYEVKSGDSLWSIASDLAALNPEYNDIRQYVADIEETNNLYSGDVKAGQTIMIPYYISPSGDNYEKVYMKYGISR